MKRGPRRKSSLNRRIPVKELSQMITGAQPDNSTQRQCWPKQYDDIDMECTCYRWDFPVSMGGILGAILFDSGHVQFWISDFRSCWRMRGCASWSENSGRRRWTLGTESKRGSAAPSWGRGGRAHTRACQRVCASRQAILCLYLVEYISLFI